MLHMKIWNVRTYFTQEYEMWSVRTYVTYENVICPNLCFEQIYDVFCPILCYIWKCVMSWHMLHMNIKLVLSELMVHRKHVMSELTLHTKMWYFSPKWCHTQQCYTSKPTVGYPRKYDDFSPSICYLQKCVISEHMLHTNTRCILSELKYIQKCSTSAHMFTRKYEHTKMCVRNNNIYPMV